MMLVEISRACKRYGRRNNTGGAPLRQQPALYSQARLLTLVFLPDSLQHRLLPCGLGSFYMSFLGACIPSRACLEARMSFEHVRLPCEAAWSHAR
jgi:hypothetical protein